LDESDTTKYVIHAKITAEGVVEQPDVVGAIFGQTEGLLGSDMDLRELQKSGRIGRIDVDVSSSRGKSTGEMRIPSSLDRVDTSILAAALETIDRIGPCLAHVEIKSVEDVRSSKRQLVVDRAKAILQEMFIENAMEGQEIAETVKRAVRIDDVVMINGLHAGPSLKESDAIVLVEGRADIRKLLTCGIKNSIAVEGTSVPPFVADLTKHKTVTAFIDSDRGGDLIIKELLQVADLNYIARPPDGKSVEDLTQKDVFKCLRNKVPIDRYLETMNRRSRGRSSGRTAQNQQTRQRTVQPENVERPKIVKSTVRSKKSTMPRRKTLTGQVTARVDSRSRRHKESDTKKPTPPVSEEPQNIAQPPRPNPYTDRISELAGTLTAKLLGQGGDELNTVAVRDLANTLKEAKNDVNGVIFDGVITQRLLDIAAEKELDFIAGVKMGNVVKQPANIKVLTLQ